MIVERREKTPMQVSQNTPGEGWTLALSQGMGIPNGYITWNEPILLMQRACLIALDMPNTQCNGLECLLDSMTCLLSFDRPRGFRNEILQAHLQSSRSISDTTLKAYQCVLCASQKCQKGWDEEWNEDEGEIFSAPFPIFRYGLDLVSSTTSGAAVEQCNILAFPHGISAEHQSTLRIPNRLPATRCFDDWLKDFPTRLCYLSRVGSDARILARFGLVNSSHP